jgi:FAD/FMN-containing dehydrogenase
MTATFSAEMTLAEAQRRLGEIGQWLPVDGWPGATLGRLVEVNSTGPLRLGFGAWRDLLLGVQFVNGRGELITAGGRTVKNVAGYDLTKFMVGQQGMFGRIVTVTTRTYRRPDGAVVVRHGADGGVVARLLDTALRPQWAMWGKGEGVSVGYLGDERTLDWYEGKLKQGGAAGVERRAVEADVAERAGKWDVGRDVGDGSVPWRAAVPPARLGELWVGMGSVAGWADAAFGSATGRLRSDAERQRLEGAVRAAGGTARVGERASATFSTSEAERQIIERLKAAFDPDGTLNPLPWQRS